MGTNIFVLWHAFIDVFAEWGEDSKNPTGPIAFATAEEAERFKSDMPSADGYHAMPITMEELLSHAEARHWTEIWTVGAPDDQGSHAWFVHPLPREAVT